MADTAGSCIRQAQFTQLSLAICLLIFAMTNGHAHPIVVDYTAGSHLLQSFSPLTSSPTYLQETEMTDNNKMWKTNRKGCTLTEHNASNEMALKSKTHQYHLLMSRKRRTGPNSHWNKRAASFGKDLVLLLFFRNELVSKSVSDTATCS